MTETIRNIATDINVISLALLAVVFILIALVWKGFEKMFTSLSMDERKSLSKNVLIFLLPILALIIVTTWVGAYSPSLVQGVALLTMLGFASIAILYLIIIGIKKFIYFISRKKKTLQVTTKIDESETFFILWRNIFRFMCLLQLVRYTWVNFNSNGYKYWRISS